MLEDVFAFGILEALEMTRGDKETAKKQMFVLQWSMVTQLTWTTRTTRKFWGY